MKKKYLSLLTLSLMMLSFDSYANPPKEPTIETQKETIDSVSTPIAIEKIEPINDSINTLEKTNKKKEFQLFGKKKKQIIQLESKVKELESTVGTLESKIEKYDSTIKSDSIKIQELLEENTKLKEEQKKAAAKKKSMSTVQKKQPVAKKYKTSPNSRRGTGTVSWYGPGFHGKLMANGKIYDQNKLTCATTWNRKTRRKGFPFGTKLRVTNKKNGKSVVVTVTDTGSFSKYGRVLDLSKGAFSRIANVGTGVINVTYEVVR